jgi:hypothetical protein
MIQVLRAGRVVVRWRFEQGGDRASHQQRHMYLAQFSGLPSFASMSLGAGEGPGEGRGVRGEGSSRPREPRRLEVGVRIGGKEEEIYGS